MNAGNRFVALLGLAIVLLGASISCGGGAGRTAVVGFGNSGNRIFEDAGITEALAEMLAEHAETPRIADEMLAEIFQSIVAQARAGDPEAALIVYRVAEEQREDDAS